MSAIISDIRDDLQKLEELKQKICDVKQELTGLNIKVEIGRKEELEKQLQSFGKEYEQIAKRVSESQATLVSDFKAINDAVDMSKPAEELRKFDEQLVRMCENLDRYFEGLKGNLGSMLNVLGDGNTIAGNIKTNNENAAQIEELKRQNAELTEEIKRRNDELEKEQQIYRQLADAVRGNNVSAIQALTQTTFESVAEIKEKLKEASKEAAKQELVVAEIQEEYDKAAKAVEKLCGKLQSVQGYWGDNTKNYQGIAQIGNAERDLEKSRERLQYVSNGLEAAKNEQTELNARVVEYSQKLEDASQKPDGIRTQLMKAREVMVQMIEAGMQGTPMFRQVAQEAGKLRREVAMANARMQYFADPNRHLTTLKTGLQGVAGAAGVAAGVIGLFNSENKKMAEIQTKVQSVLGIIIGLETTYNMVKNTSNIMFAIEEVKTWALAKARGTQAVATVAATGAQEALNTAMRANPIGAVISLLAILGTAIYGIIKVLTSETEAEKKACEEKERHIKAIKEQHEGWAKSVASSASKQLTSYEELRRKWNKLGDNLEAKKKFVLQNQQAFNELGWAVNSVTDADNLLVNNTDAVVKAIMARAKAAAYQNLATQELEKQIQIQLSKDVEKGGAHYKLEGDKVKAGTKVHIGDAKKRGQITREELEAVGGKINSYGGDIYLSDSQVTEIEKRRSKKAKERKKKLIDESNDRIKQIQANAQKEYEAEAEAIKKTGVKAYTGKDKPTKKDTTAERLEESKEKMQQIRSKQQMEQKRAARDLWFSTREAEIKAMDEGTEKVLAQMELDREKELDQIERSYEDLRMKRVEEAKKLWDADLKNKGKNFYESAEFEAANKNTSAETANRNARKNAAEKEFARRERELRNGQIQAMRDYLKEYGSLEQQKYAITKEYDDKIAKESDSSQKALLQKQKEHLLAELDMKQLQQSIDWEMVFDDLDRASTEALGGLRDKLRTMLNGGDVNPENAKVLSEKILEIENEIAERSSVWSSLIPALKDRERMTREVARAEEDAANAAERVFKANNKVFLAQNAAKDAIKNATGKEVAIKDLGNVEFIEKLRSELDTATTAGKAADEALANLAVAAADAATAQKEYTSAQLVTKNKKDILAGMSGGLGGIMSGAVDAAGGDALGIMNVANQNIQSMKDLVETMGLSETDFGIAVNEFASGSQGFVDAVNALASGDIVGAVNGVLEGVAGYAKGFTTLFAGSGNEKEKEAEIEKLARSNEILAKAIDGLSEKILKSDSTNKESIEAYRKAISAEKEWEANQRKAINARASEYANTGYGFLGLGGKSSFNAKMSATWAGWSDFTKVLKQNGINKSVSKNNIWSLTPEEMKLLRDFAPTRWKELFNGDGHKNPEELVNEYIERAGMGEKLVSDLNEKLTGYRWEGFLDSYKSMLKDLTSDNKTFADNLEEMLSNAILESLVNDVYKERIRGIYKMVADAADENGDGGTDITEKEANAIRDANKKLADDMLARRQQLIDLGLIKVSKGYDDQSASQIGVDKITSEQADKGIGILTAIQIATEQMRNKMYESDGKIPVLTATADDLRAIQVNVRDIASETRDFVVSTYLEVREINAHQANIEKAVVDMQPRVAEIERGIKELA